jgi:hypothetical protein
MASAELSRRVEKVVGYSPLSEMDETQRREFHEALLDTGGFEDLPGKWQAAILEAEQNRPNLRVVTATSTWLLCRGLFVPGRDLIVCERRLDILLDRPAERC